MLETAPAATDLDLISYLKAIPDARMRRGVRFPAWYLLLVTVLGILSGCQSLGALERFAIRHYSVLTEGLGLELHRPPSDSSFRYLFLQVDVTAMCAAIRDWTIAQSPGGAGDLEQLICDGKTLRGSIDPTAAAGIRDAKPFQAPHLYCFTKRTSRCDTSLRTTPEDLLQQLRDRWSIERWNWIRDTQLLEDGHRDWGNGAGAMATLRTAALNQLRLDGFESVRGAMQAVMHDITALLALAWRQPEPKPC